MNYVFSIFARFKGKKGGKNVDDLISIVNQIEYNIFIRFHKTIFESLQKISFNIAGNIDEELVERIHNHTKAKIKIKSKFTLLNKPLLKDDYSPKVVNYYQKSTMEVTQNGIIVAYEIPKNLSDICIQLFKSCFQVIAFDYLRFNYSNAYTPSIYIRDKSFIIFEQGLFKEVDQMEDDINNVLLGVINGTINVSNYNEILQSFLLDEKKKTEKDMDYLFEKFIQGNDKLENNELESGELNDISPPQSFKDLVDILAPMFTAPKRTTILIARNTLSDEEFKKMYQKRSEIKEYPLNKTINITHIDNFTSY